MISFLGTDQRAAANSAMLQSLKLLELSNNELKMCFLQDEFKWTLACRYFIYGKTHWLDIYFSDNYQIAFTIHLSYLAGLGVARGCSTN